MIDESSQMTEKAYPSKNIDTRNELIKSHLNMARMVAHKFSGRGVDYDDLFQVASLALVKAIDRYDERMGIPIASYAIPTMVGEVKNFFRDKTYLIRLPRRNTELLQNIDRTSEALKQSLNRMPTAIELSEALGIPVDTVLEAMEAKHARHPISLDHMDSVSDNADETINLHETFGLEDAGYAHADVRDTVNRALAGLADIERRIIAMRYSDNLSQRETAKLLGVSQMTVSRSERRAMEKLKEFFGRQEEFL